MKKPVIILLLALRACQPCPAGITADTIFLEARGESLAGRYAVASVIWNRHIKTGMPLKGVCLRRRAFSCWSGGWYHIKTADEREAALLRQIGLWEALMLDGRFKPSGKWDHYCRIDCFPAWRAEMTNTRIIGNHIFGNCN